MSTRKVYIVIVNWNGWRDTIECLESVYRSDYNNFQIIVVDNGSDDGSLGYLKAWAKNELCVWSPESNTLRKYSIPPISIKIPYISYTIEKADLGDNQEAEVSLSDNISNRSLYALIFIEVKKNLGFGKGNNIALRYILAKKDHDYVWLLNNDTVIEPTSLSLMVDPTYNSPAIVGSILKYYYSPSKVQAYGGGYLSLLTGRVRTENKTKPMKLDFVTGASFMIDKSSLIKIGLFDENIFMYFEENEYCIRAQKSGVTMTVSDAIVFHKGGAASSNSYFQWKNVYQGKIYTFAKHFGLGPWILGVATMWIINIFNPRISSGKKRASREATTSLYQIIKERLRNKCLKNMQVEKK